jgi:hypothetical protein
MLGHRFISAINQELSCCHMPSGVWIIQWSCWWNQVWKICQPRVRICYPFHSPFIKCRTPSWLDGQWQWLYKLLIAIRNIPLRYTIRPLEVWRSTAYQKHNQNADFYQIESRPLGSGCWSPRISWASWVSNGCNKDNSWGPNRVRGN